MLTYEKALQHVLQTVEPLTPQKHPLLEATADHPKEAKGPLEIVGTSYAGHPFAGTITSVTYLTAHFGPTEAPKCLTAPDAF